MARTNHVQISYTIQHTTGCSPEYHQAFEAHVLNLSSYNVISMVLKPLMISGFYLRSLSQKAYRDRISERLGYYQGAFKTGGIVIHGASVGEIISLQPFIAKVMQQYPDTPITVTSFTPTGSQQVTKRFGDTVQHCYLPIDETGPVKRFLEALKPQVIVIMETEIWPSLINQSHKQTIKLLLINGRLSQKSFPRYQKIGHLISSTLQKIDRILAQSTSDQHRFISLGANSKKLSVSGNIKYDLSPPQQNSSELASLKQHLSDRTVWVVGSSHEDEEDLILTTYLHLLKDFPDLLLIVAPRHPERVTPFTNKINASALSYTARSNGSIPTLATQIWLIDTMGELLLFYQLAQVCTIAGSFGVTGGHNPLEACLFAKPIVVGPNMANFSDITKELARAKAMVQLKESSPTTLATTLKKLLSQPSAARTMGTNAANVLKTNRGALAASLAALHELFTQR